MRDSTNRQELFDVIFALEDWIEVLEKDILNHHDRDVAVPRCEVLFALLNNRERETSK